MTIEITKCKNPLYWYFDKVGKLYTVDHAIEDCYKVKVGSASYCVMKSDCKIIEQ